MEELPDPTTFFIRNSCIDAYGCCTRCRKRRDFKDASTFYHESFEEGTTNYLCQIAIKPYTLTSTEMLRCDNEVVVNDEYNSRCVELVTKLYTDANGADRQRAYLIMNWYIRYYDSYEPPTKPAVE